MLINYTQSRAAILCFGGWGLQVLLHLKRLLPGVITQLPDDMLDPLRTLENTGKRLYR